MKQLRNANLNPKIHKTIRMKTKIYILFLFAFILVLPCIAQQSQTTLPKVENHLKGEIDYTHEALELVQMQDNGEEISLGKINEDGTIRFNLPEFNIKALYDSIPSTPYSLQGWLSMDGCKDKDAFAQTPYDDVYSKKYDLYVKKYGMSIAVLEPMSNKKMVSIIDSPSDSLGDSSTYFWFYIDRPITYKEKCSKTNSSTGAIHTNISADIQFEKGWNFIEENLVSVQSDSQGDSQTFQPNKTHFTKISPENKKVKWSLRQITKDEKILTAKRLHNLTPIPKEQFEKWIPNKLGDLSVTTKEYGTLPERRKNKNNIHLTYTDETQKKEIDLYVVDCAKSPDDMEMANFSYAMENRGKDKKDIKPYIAQFSERKNATQFMYKVDDRILVEASGININGEELWEYVQKLNVEKLLKE